MLVWIDELAAGAAADLPRPTLRAAPRTDRWVARFGALAMYLVHTGSRPLHATLGASVAMLLLSFFLADIEGANQGPAWLAAITGSFGVAGGLGALIFHAYREWRQQSREDAREREAIRRLDQREREFVARMDRNYREHRESIAAELAEHQTRLDAINAEIEAARERRHLWVKGVNRDMLDLESRLQDQEREIATLKAEKANGWPKPQPPDLYGIGGQP